jgi:DNA-binding CsgD family transcriptional regulator
LEHLPHPVMLLDAAGNIVYCNAAARLAARACGLVIAGQQLHATTPALSEQVDTATRFALNGRPTIVRCEQDGIVSHWLFHPYRDGGSGLHEDGAIALGPTASTPRTLEVFANAYALSRAERRVLRHLVDGKAGVAGVAASTGTSVSTVRSHLRNLFQKTGTRKQSELVRLGLSLPAAPLDADAPPCAVGLPTTNGSSI